jgi:hypothetical protein
MMDLIMILLRQTTARWKEAKEGEDEIGAEESIP